MRSSFRLAARAATRCSRPARCRTSAASDPATTSICSTAPRSPTSCSTTSSINPSVDSIQEFKIQKSMYPAEFGGKASALINVATRPGGNAFHGSAVRVPSQRHVRRAQLLRRRRSSRCRRFGRISSAAPSAGRSCGIDSFFFVSYEGQRMDRSLTRTFSVPSDARASGNFAGLAPICDPLTIADTGAARHLRTIRFPPTESIRSLPRCSRRCRCRRRRPVPEPHVGRGAARDIDQFSVRIDHRLATRDQLFGRFSTFDADETAAVRHERAAGNARARVRPHARHQDAQCRRQPYATLRHVAC